MAKSWELDKKGKRKKIKQSTGLHLWQQAHIEKGVEAAQKDDFASDRETADFFNKYGRRSN